MTTNELQELANGYVRLAASKKDIDAGMKAAKEEIVDELEKVDDTKFDFHNGLTAAKQTRKGTVDVKALQIKYGISDDDLDLLRKQPTVSWVLKVK